jgi:hypothetical protein
LDNKTSILLNKGYISVNCWLLKLSKKAFHLEG